MRSSTMALALVLAAGTALAPAVRAQPNPPGSDTTRSLQNRGADEPSGSAMPTAPGGSAGSLPNTTPHAARAPAANDLPAYAQMLQQARERIQAASGAATQHPTTQNGAAMTPERMQLVHALQEALGTVRHVPASFASQQVYKDTENRLRNDASRVQQAMRPNSRSDNADPAEDAMQALDALYQKVVAAGGTPPTNNPGATVPVRVPQNRPSN